MKKDYHQPPSYPLRLEADTRSKLEAIAKANGRSLNAEIVIRLDASLAGDDTHGNDLELTIRTIAREVVREELAKSGK